MAHLDFAPSAPMLADGAVRETYIGWAVITAFFGLFLGWAALTRVDAAAYASGFIAVSGNRQVVQHRSGGTIAQIMVREGQRVKQGDILLVLAGESVQAEERSLASQVIGLQAERARLVAERQGLSTIVAPSEFARLESADRADAIQAMTLQRSTLHARRATISDQKLVLGQKSAELSAQIRGIEQRIAANNTQSRLFGDELASLRALTARGFVSVNRLRALERAQAALGGETAGLSASIATSREQISEAELQTLALESQTIKEVSENLRTVAFSLNELLPKYSAAREALARTMIRSPALGQVVGLKVSTVGGVVAPGETLMEIVPERAALVVQVQVTPQDADNITVGQPAEIRIAALQGRGRPLLMGKVTKLSADNMVDQRSGQHYFSAEIGADPASLAIYRQAVGAKRIKAGLPAQVIVSGRRRTMLEYLLDPLDQALWRSFRET